MSKKKIVDDYINLNLESKFEIVKYLELLKTQDSLKIRFYRKMFD